MIGLALILLVVFTAIFAPLLIQDHPSFVEVDTDQGTTRVEERWNINFENKLLPPGPEHFFGTDDFGRDIYSMVVWGTQISLRLCLMVVLTATIIGVILGGVAGYFGGKID